MWKKIVFGIGIVALIGGAIYWFTYTKELHTPVSEAINAIPGNAAVIFESKQSRKTWKKLVETSMFWQELLGTEIFSKLDYQARYIDSLVGLDAAVSTLLNNHSLFISAHVSGATTFDFLYVYSLPNLTHQAPIKDFFRKINKNKEPASRTYSGTEISTIYSHLDYKDSMSFAFLDGILMMSSKPTLVEDAIRQLNSGTSIIKDKNFSKIIATAGKNVDANVYVNYKNIPGILSHFTDPLVKREITAIPDFADCSGWDIAIKPNALSFSGFTQANDSSVSFLNIFRKQKPSEVELTRVIPSKTALLLFFGISNIKTFHHDYKNYLSATQQLRLQSYEQYMESLEKKYGVSIELSMLEWISGEMALVVTEPVSVDFANNSYAVIRAGDIDEALKSLNELSDVVKHFPATTKGEGADTRAKLSGKEKNDKSLIGETGTEYRNHTINYINIPQLLPQLFGLPFKKISNCYYTFINDYVIFGNSNEALQNFIDDFENNKVLANDKNYKTFSENISSEANVYLYSSIARSANLYSTLLTEQLAKDLEDKRDILYRFEAAGIQFTLNKKNNLFYGNAYLKYNPAYKQESGTLWESELDTSVSSKPFLIINHNTQTKEIIVQDDANKLYLISNAGKILWTKQLPDKIISDIKQVDALKNDKLQIVFNTRNAIYMYDRNGKDMRGFPLKLESAATNAISIFDYDNSRDYRIFVACENKKIRCFKINGEEVSGFKFGKTEAEVRLPLQYQKMEGKDHLFAVDREGKVYLFNRHGETLVKLKENLPEEIQGFYIEPGKDYNQTLITAADTLGNVIKINLSGSKEKITLRQFDSSPFFDCQDINNDKIKDYIFIVDKELMAFSQDKSLLFKHEFKESISRAPLFFIFPDGSGKIGVLSDKTNELFVFNADGTLYPGFPLTGNTAFSIGDLNNNGVYMLVTGSAENSIYVYQLLPFIPGR
jgi:hypothetical protein